MSCTDEDIETDDEQNGQDMKIRYGGKILYYLECKAKWSFSSEPAHMSSQQMKQAVRNKDWYALLCVDCTPTGAKVSPDANEEAIMEAHLDILNNTWVHTDIGKLLSPTIEPQVRHEDDQSIDAEKTIRVYSSLSCNISKTVFISGAPFFTFMTELKENLKAQIESFNL